MTVSILVSWMGCRNVFTVPFFYDCRVPDVGGWGGDQDHRAGIMTTLTDQRKVPSNAELSNSRYRSSPGIIHIHLLAPCSFFESHVGLDLVQNFSKGGSS